MIIYFGQKEEKEHTLQRDDPSKAEGAHGRVVRDEQGEAHLSNTTPCGGIHLELP